MSEAAASVVLVHGAWHGAWCWSGIVDRLKADGVAVTAIDLPGRGADPAPLGDLHADARRVRQILDGADTPVVLVGHSYGGAVITEAGDHPAVARLVYLSALALDGHETCTGAAADEAAAADISHEGRPDLGAALTSDGQGAVTVERGAAAACFYKQCDSETVEWALDQLGPHRLVALEQRPDAVAWRIKPSTYIVCTEDLVVHPDLQRILARRCTNSIEWDSDHSPFLSHPDRLARALHELAVSAATES
jgi:pimeloyl-ACP methyl ester carboxylesterase